MVCPRCIKVVKDELNKLGIYPSNISLGEVELVEQLPLNLLDKVKEVLLENGWFTCCFQRLFLSSDVHREERLAEW